MNIQPKPYLDNMRMRRKAVGTERRRNMDKIILEKGTPFPLSTELSDIDASFQEWVNSLDVSYDGKKLPIFKLFSNQRIGEYSQTWQHLDEVGNPLLNFFAVTRENNPKQGQNQGGMYNIPGNRDYPMFFVPTLQENGEEAYDMYSMKQPFCVDLTYSLTLITNKYELLNEVNQKILNEFKALECYIAPNGHYMPMKLDDISDESEYGIDDRKYYAQTFKITLLGYIIRKEDFKVTKLPTRVIGRVFGWNNNNKDKKKAEIKVIEDYDEELSCCNIRDKEVEEYIRKGINLEINFPICAFVAKFEIDVDFAVTDIRTDNIYDFVMKINEEYVNFDEGIDIYKGDIIYIEIERNDKMKKASINIIGETEEMVENEDKESALDDQPIREDIVYNA